MVFEGAFQSVAQRLHRDLGSENHGVRCTVQSESDTQLQIIHTAALPADSLTEWLCTLQAASA